MNWFLIGTWGSGAGLYSYILAGNQELRPWNVVMRKRGRHPQGGGVDFLKAKSDVTKPKPLMEHHRMNTYCRVPYPAPPNSTQSFSEMTLRDAGRARIDRDGAATVPHARRVSAPATMVARSIDMETVWVELYETQNEILVSPGATNIDWHCVNKKDMSGKKRYFEKKIATIEF